MDWIPLAGFILALLVQSFYLIRWGSQIATRVVALEARMDKKDAEQKAIEAELAKADNRLVRMETIMETLVTRMVSMESKLDRTFDAISGLAGSVRVLNENALRANPNSTVAP